MEFKELCIHVKKFNKTSITQFWDEVEETGLTKNIDIYFDYEVVSLIAYSRKPYGLIVFMAGSEDGYKWDDLTDDETLSEDEYCELMGQFISDLFELTKKYQPVEFQNVRYLSNWFENDDTNYSRCLNILNLKSTS